MDIKKKIYECSPKGYYGVDKIGRPLYVDMVGKLDTTKLFQVLTEEQIM